MDAYTHGQPETNMLPQFRFEAGGKVTLGRMAAGPAPYCFFHIWYSARPGLIWCHSATARAGQIGMDVWVGPAWADALFSRVYAHVYVLNLNIVRSQYAITYRM